MPIIDNITVRIWNVGDAHEAERLAQELAYLHKMARRSRYHHAARARARDVARELSAIRNRYV